jgi:hypothetical protein
MISNSLFIAIGLMAIIAGVILTSNAYAQEDNPSALELSASIITTIIGLIIVLIPVIRRELVARNVQNPTLTKLLDQVEYLSQSYKDNQEKFLQMAQIIYEGLPDEYVNNIDNKYAVKLKKLKEDFEQGKIKAEEFIAIYTSLRPAVKNDRVSAKKIVRTD